MELFKAWWKTIFLAKSKFYVLPVAETPLSLNQIGKHAMVMYNLKKLQKRKLA